jgi:hypothetical protein
MILARIPMNILLTGPDGHKAKKQANMPVFFKNIFDVYLVRLMPG